MKWVKPAICTLLLLLSMPSIADESMASPLDEYQASVVSSETPLYPSVSEAIKHAAATPLEINPGFSPTRWQLSKALPRLQIGNSISNFLLFTIELDQDEPYSFMIQSLCNPRCIGPLTSAVRPTVFLVDPSGEVLTDATSNVVAIPGVFMLEIKGKAKRFGSYKILIAADNRELGAPIVTAYVGLASIPFSSNKLKLEMVSSPFGKIVAFAKHKKKK